MLFLSNGLDKQSSNSWNPNPVKYLLCNPGFACQQNLFKGSEEAISPATSNTVHSIFESFNTTLTTLSHTTGCVYLNNYC